MTIKSIFAILFIATQAINTPATAQNKCLINGQTTYQDTDCPKGTDQAPKTTPKEKATPPLNLSESAQRKAMLEKMEKELAAELKIIRSQPPTTTAADLNEQAIPMPFDQCVASVNKTLKSLSVQRRNASHIIDSGNLTITKVCTTDGIVLIGCNKADATMMISRIHTKC